MKRGTLKLFALGGVAGPVLFTLITFICASFRDGYSHIAHFISELGANGTSNADLMNFAGFIPAGILIAFFGVSLILVLPKNFLTRLGSVLITIFGIGMAVVGFFSCDPGCPRVGSLENNIHDQISGPIFISAISGILLLGISFRNLPAWRRFWIYSLLSSLFSFCFIIALINSLQTNTFTGLWQRLLLLTLFVWFGIIGLHIFRLKSDIGETM